MQDVYIWKGHTFTGTTICMVATFGSSAYVWVVRYHEFTFGNGVACGGAHHPSADSHHQLRISVHSILCSLYTSFMVVWHHKVADIHTHIHMHSHTNTYTHRYTHTNTHTHTQSHTHTHTEPHTCTHTCNQLLFCSFLKHTQTQTHTCMSTLRFLCLILKCLP